MKGLTSLLLLSVAALLNAVPDGPGSGGSVLAQFGIASNGITSTIAPKDVSNRDAGKDGTEAHPLEDIPVPSDTTPPMTSATADEAGENSKNDVDDSFTDKQSVDLGPLRDIDDSEVESSSDDGRESKRAKSVLEVDDNVKQASSLPSPSTGVLDPPFIHGSDNITILDERSSYPQAGRIRQGWGRRRGRRGRSYRRGWGKRRRYWRKKGGYYRGKSFGRTRVKIVYVKVPQPQPKPQPKQVSTCHPACSNGEKCFKGTCREYPPTCHAHCYDDQRCTFTGCQPVPKCKENCGDLHICTKHGCVFDPFVY